MFYKRLLSTINVYTFNEEKSHSSKDKLLLIKTKAATWPE